MAIIKWQNEQRLSPSLNHFFHDFFGENYRNSVAVGTSIPAVNIKDTDSNFEVSLAAPGLDKENFKISLENQILTISSDQKSEKEESEGGKFTRREYSYSSFSRSFTIPESVNTEEIDAKYENGELVIRLPKKVKTTAAVKEIAIQ